MAKKERIIYILCDKYNEPACAYTDSDAALEEATRAREEDGNIFYINPITLYTEEIEVKNA